CLNPGEPHGLTGMSVLLWFGPARRSRLRRRCSRGVWIGLSLLYLLAQGIDFRVSSNQRLFQAIPARFQYFDLGQYPPTFIFQLPAARLACLLRMYCPKPGGMFNVLWFQCVIDLLKLRLQIRKLALNFHLLRTQTLGTLLVAR